jgi:hypothetical protein
MGHYLERRQKEVVPYQKYLIKSLLLLAATTPKPNDCWTQYRDYLISFELLAISDPSPIFVNKVLLAQSSYTHSFTYYL